ncbi:CDP-glycerol glycerophosphotransferase family protein [Actinomyces sp. 565]|uniref:CDP-glycerol glycerophosphotransferase family protein n=1 Tax=Actinomyces sp. 565 TaxID=2057794 RepID=UPI0013A70B65|nr:CDP-glycerol glycerophosphotransferase family protein [Actinomyces sp. 565]NDR53602.1 glycosyltransferase [Actinomyces sp. 565]
MKLISNVRLGQYYEHRSNFARAREYYQTAQRNSEEGSAFALGNLEYRLKNYEAAVPLLRAALKADPTNSVAERRLAFSLEKTGACADAVALVDARAKAGQQTNSDKLIAARLHMRQGEVARAREYYAAVVQDLADPKVDIEYLSTFTKKDPAWLRASAMAEVAERHSDNAEWLYNYATVLEDAGQLPAAAEAFEASAALSGGSWTYYRAGYAHERAGDRGRSRHCYLMAQDRDQKLDAKKWGLGVFHEEGRHYDAAAETYRNDAAASPEVWRRAGLLYRAATMKTMLCEFPDAAQLLRSAVNLRPMNTEWIEDLAMALQLSGARDAALTEYRKLLNLLAEDNLTGQQSRIRTLQREISRCFEDAGYYVAAYEALRESMGLAPSRALEPTKQTEAASDIAGGPSWIPSAEFPDEADVIRSDSGVSQVDPVEEPIAPLRFFGSTDRRGHEERARLAERAGDTATAIEEYRYVSLLSHPLAAKTADRYAELLADTGDFRGAVGVLKRTTTFNRALPKVVDTPRTGTYTAQLAAYVEWSEDCAVEDDVILYEANLGISIDCSPLALCREILRSHPGEFLHVWAVDEHAVLPEDLADRADVIVVRKDSLQYTRLLATAKYLINNSTWPTYFTRRLEQRYLMTWHGTPLKTLAKDMQEPLVHLNMARNYLQATYAIFPNEHTRSVMINGCDVNGLTKARIEITGYPRNDVLVEAAGDTHCSGARRALFAPTWREDSELEEQVQTLLAIRDALADAGYDTYLRAHHYVEQAALRIDPTIEFVPRHVSTYDLLPDIDLLVTDFSSIYFDFALTRRPMVFYVPDWDRYAENRGVYFDQSHLPGIVCDNLESLRAAISAPKVDLVEREAFIAEFGPADDGHSSERVAEAFLASRDEAYPQRDLGGGSSGLLVRQSLIPNGMASSFVNLITVLADQGTSLTVLTEGRPVQNEPGREETMRKLPANVRVIGRVGAQPRSCLEVHAQHVAHKLAYAPGPGLDSVITRLFVREGLRVLPGATFDAVIEFDGYSEFMARLVLGIADSKASKVLYLHNDIQGEIELRMPELSAVVSLIPRFDHAVSVSAGLMETNARRLPQAHGIPDANFTYARNVIVPDVLERLADEQSIDGFIDWCGDSRPLFVHVGRMSPEKNHGFLLNAFASFRKECSDARLVLLGDGPLRPQVEAQIHGLGIEQAVFVPGWVRNPYPILARADAMLIPSLHEGQPMVILEARALGTAVIGSDIDGIRAMGPDGAQRILPLEHDLWVDAMRRWKECREAAARFESRTYSTDAIREFWRAIGRCGVEKGSAAAAEGIYDQRG